MTEIELNKKYLKLRIYCNEILDFYERGEYNLVDERFKRLKASIEQNIISI
jgi:serine/threonine-protein kinase RIO1